MSFRYERKQKLKREEEWRGKKGKRGKYNRKIQCQLTNPLAFDALPANTKGNLEAVTNGNPELIISKRFFVISAVISDQLIEAVFRPYLFGMTKETNEGLSTLELYLACKFCPRYLSTIIYSCIYHRLFFLHFSLIFLQHFRTTPSMALLLICGVQQPSL